jgi:hypothetical protein
VTTQCNTAMTISELMGSSVLVLANESGILGCSSLTEREHANEHYDGVVLSWEGCFCLVLVMPWGSVERIKMSTGGGGGGE